MPGKKKQRATKLRGPSQREVLRDAMLGAAQCESWLTLRELSALTRYGEASISAQLRHLRKPRCGAFVVDKQVREPADSSQKAAPGAVWEYRLRRNRFGETARVSIRKPALPRSFAQAAGTLP